MADYNEELYQQLRVQCIEKCSEFEERTCYKVDFINSNNLMERMKENLGLESVNTETIEDLNKEFMIVYSEMMKPESMSFSEDSDKILASQINSILSEILKTLKIPYYGLRDVA